MRNRLQFRSLIVFGLMLAAPAAFATASSAEHFGNGDSWYGEPVKSLGVNNGPVFPNARVVDLPLSGSIDVTWGDTVTFRSGGQQFSWTFNGLGSRSVDIQKLAPDGFPASPLRVYISRSPLMRT